MTSNDINSIEEEAIGKDVGKTRAATDNFIEQLGHAENELTELDKRLVNAVTRATAFLEIDPMQEPAVSNRSSGLKIAYKSAARACAERRSALEQQQQLWM